MPKVIKAENISKAYQLGDFGTGTISRDLERFLARLRGKEDPFLKIGEINDRTKKGKSDVVWSLKDINFEVEQGDTLGIIGRNGAGKSTLLKILARVTSPSTGSVKIKGRVASLLEVGTGFHPELTGKENIYLNGAILGMRKAEIKRKFDEIVDFAGVERYIGTPVKRYSSGMYVRLAFAVAAHLESEILIVDEVLAVGDAEFQKKCLGKMGDISKGEGRTVLFVSHNMGSITQLCQSGLLLVNGKILDYGFVSTVVKNYMSLTANENHKLIREDLKKVIYIKEIVSKNSHNEITNNFRHNENIVFEFKIARNTVESMYRLIVIVQDELKRKIFSAEKIITDDMLKLTIRKDFLTRGSYSLNCIIYIPGITQYDHIDSCSSFSVLDAGSDFAHLESFDYGTVFGEFLWE